MKRIITLLLAFSLLSNVYAQKGINIGISTGVTNYFGDLGNEEFMQASSIKPGVALTFRNLISPKEVSGMQYSAFDVEARLSWHRIGYEETSPVNGNSGFQLQNYGRGLGFRSDVYGLSTHLTYTYYPNRRLPLHRQSVALFAFTGVGMFYSNAKADLFRGDINIENRYFYWSDGTIRDQAEQSGVGNIIEKDGKYETTLRDWFTEGQGSQDDVAKNKDMYSPWQIGIPIGFGFRYGLNKAISLSLEFGYYKFLTDYLDDVSDAYATYNQIEQRFPNDPIKQELAKYISDPTGLGTNGTPGPATSRRGNPNVSDSYSFINIEFAYRIDWSPKKLTTAWFK
jgi:hypothetical protein